MRQFLIISVCCVGLLGLIWAGLRTWTTLGGIEMSMHGYIAMELGIFFTVFLGCGLMALVFFQAGRVTTKTNLNRDFGCLTLTI